MFMCLDGKAITDQHITKGAESLHADLAPLVCEKDIFQPFVDHGVHFLQPYKEITKHRSPGSTANTDISGPDASSFDNGGFKHI